MGDENMFIEHLEEKPLSDADILAITGPDCLVVPYSYLKHVATVHQLFKYHTACILLYKTGPNFGHWVCLTWDPDTDVLYYFDSYGKPIDYWLDRQDQATRDKLGQGVDYLRSLVHRALVNGSLNGVSVSTKALQSSDSHVANCGRYAALRALFSYLSNEDFIRMISDNKGYGTVTDKNVSLLTALLEH